MINGKNNPEESIMGKENKLTNHQEWDTEPVLNCLESQSENLSKMEYNEKIYDLVDVIEEGISKDESVTDDAVKEEIKKNVSEIAERVAREMFPQIAERLIREEIEKLKGKVEE